MTRQSDLQLCKGELPLKVLQFVPVVNSKSDTNSHMIDTGSQSLSYECKNSSNNNNHNNNLITPILVIIRPIRIILSMHQELSWLQQKRANQDRTIRWTPTPPATVTIRDNGSFIWVLLYSDCTTITGRGGPPKEYRLCSIVITCFLGFRVVLLLLNIYSEYGIARGRFKDACAHTSFWNSFVPLGILDK